MECARAIGSATAEAFEARDQIISQLSDKLAERDRRVASLEAAFAKLDASLARAEVRLLELDRERDGRSYVSPPARRDLN